jgi:UDP-glucose 4-epimerase
MDSKKYDITVFDLPESCFDGFEKPGFKYFFGSILDKTALLEAFRGADIVIHLAAYLGVERTEKNRLRGIDINIFGTQNVVECAAMSGVQKVIFASSSEIYGSPDVATISEECNDRGKSVYAITKLAGEEILRAYANEMRMTGVVVRFFNTFGPRQEPQFVIPKFINNVVQGRSPEIYGDGSQTRSYCYVKDSAAGLIKAMEYEGERNFEIFNIGNPKNKVDLKTLAKMVCEIYGEKGIQPKIIGNFENTDRSADREIARRVCDITKARTTLDYQPEFSLEQALTDMKIEGLPIARWAN